MYALSDGLSTQDLQLQVSPESSGLLRPKLAQLRTGWPLGVGGMKGQGHTEQGYGDGLV